MQSKKPGLQSMSTQRQMPLRCPTLIVRHPAGKEYWAEQEIGDTLFPHDPNVEIKHTPYRGVILVYTSLPTEKAYQLTLRETYTSINKVIPATHCTTIDKLKETLNSITEKCQPCARLDIHIRGQKAKTTITEEKIEKTLSQLKLCVSRKCPKTLHIETIEEILIVSCTENVG